jgi:hypothetical protein
MIEIPLHPTIKPGFEKTEDDHYYQRAKKKDAQKNRCGA